VAGLITSPSPLKLVAPKLPNELISAFPLVLIPTYLVAVSVLFHLASLAMLHRAAGQANAQRSMTPISK
jgi:hypothetical protein